jgi:hypothetical protein
MQSTRVERPEQLALEVGRWSVSVMTIAVTVVFVIVVGMFANSARKNNDRAEDWRRRAVAAEEVVGGLRVVLAERSQALNQRTRQANELIGTLASSRGKLRISKASLGTLTRRQRQLAADKARTETARRKLQARQAALASAASALNACSQGLEAFVGSGKKPSAAARRSRLEQCSRAQARYRAYLQAG